MKYYTSKKKAFLDKENGDVLCNYNITKYFLLKDYPTFLELIKSEEKPCFYEYISDNCPVKLYLDIEIYKETNPVEYDNHVEIISGIKNDLQEIFKNYICNFIILESHSPNVKKSYHIIVNLRDDKGNVVYFENVKVLKVFIKKQFPILSKSKMIDTSVYREGIFRTYLSSKKGENRPLVKSNLSDSFDELDTFVCNKDTPDNFTIYSPNENTKTEIEKVKPEKQEKAERTRCETELTKNESVIIQKFVKSHFKLSSIVVKLEDSYIIVSVSDKYCYNIHKEHKSNNQYILIDNNGAKQKCHDEECKFYKHNEIKFDDFPQDLSQVIIKYLGTFIKETELVNLSKQECKTYITENFDKHLPDIEFDKNLMMFRGIATENFSTSLGFKTLSGGTCTNCQIEHQISNTGYCMKCMMCNSIFPKNTKIPVDAKYKNLSNFWINYTQLVNHGTINNVVLNIYQQHSDENIECDIKIDNVIFNDKKITGIINECLDGHKITKMAELMKYIYKDFIFTGDDWYYFDSIKWNIDKKSLNFKKYILELCNIFNKIKTHYEAKQTNELNQKLIKNIKVLINKFNKPQLKEDILKEAQLFYIDNKFLSNLNSKKHLVPFENGTFDLIKKVFRSTKKTDYINLSTFFDYNDNVRNPEVYKFLEEILPIKTTRDYVLKKLSECLNGNIPNTNFLMFIGDGANGKSQLLNLMKVMMGELGEKVEVTLLTRKRGNANEANTEKIKLMNKRFAYLSEPEDGEKINISLLKELTGSEEIVARGLYQGSMSFMMETKLFLACNELPEIRGEDIALWRRIKVIEFGSRFVDDPQEGNEYKIDRTLPNRMREDITWRQTFMNILLDYYFQDIIEPESVKINTNKYRQDNSEFESWLQENVVYKENSILQLKQVCEKKNGTTVGPRTLSKYKKEIEHFIKKNFKSINHELQNTSFKGHKYRGWLHLSINE